MKSHDLLRTKPGLALGLQGLVTDWTDAKGEEQVASAKALVKGIKRALARRGRGRAAPAGSPPYRQSGRLYRSVRHGLRDGERVVAITDFKGLFHEEGVSTDAPIRSGKRRRRAGVARRSIRLPKRPFMEKGFELARDEMVNTTVVAARVRAGKLVVG